MKINIDFNDEKTKIDNKEWKLMLLSLKSNLQI